MSRTHFERMTRLTTLSLALAPALAASACAVEPADSAPALTPAASADPSPTSAEEVETLHSISLGPDHTVDFIRLMNGQVAVREDRPIDSGPGALDGLTKNTATVLDVFKQLRPDASVPQGVRLP